MGSSDDVLGAFTAVLLQWLMAVLAVVSLAALASGQSPTTTPVLDEGVEVLHFERMSYPLYERSAPSEASWCYAPRWTPMVR